MFQHTAARRRLGLPNQTEQKNDRFNTQPPEGGWVTWVCCGVFEPVSTHSRPKAAGRSIRRQQNGRGRFHTQPPEGGWLMRQETLLP